MALNVLMIVSGFPSTDNSSRGSFNLVAAQLLSKKNNLWVLRMRAWKPGRKFITDEVMDKFKIITISFPLINFPFFSSITLNHFFIKAAIFLLKSKFYKVDIIHAVGGGLPAYVANRISIKIKKNYIIQYIGSDVNFYLKKYKNNSNVKNYIYNSSYNTFNSKDLLDKVKSMFPKIKNSEVIYRGIDLKSFKFSMPKSEKLKILFLGGLVSDDNDKYKNNLKGGVTLLSSWVQLDKIENLESVELLFGGPNSNLVANYIKKDNLRFPNSLNIIGEINKSLVKRMMENSKVVVIPSLFEGLPNVAYEAMASGNFIIGSNVGGIPEIIDASIGILIEPNSVDELIKALLVVIKNKQIVNNGIINSKERIIFFDNNIFLEKYSEVYQKQSVKK